MPKSNLIQNIVGGTNASDVRLVNLSDSMNMFTEAQGTGSSATSILRSISGTKTILNLSNGGNTVCRGLYVAKRNYLNQEQVFVVFGEELWCVYYDEFGNLQHTFVYRLNNLTSVVSMVENGGVTTDTAYLFVCDGAQVIAIKRLVEPSLMEASAFSINLPYRLESLTERIVPTKLCFLYDYLVVNDSTNDCFYVSRQYPLEKLKEGEIDPEGTIDYDVFGLDKYGEQGFYIFAEWQPDIISNMATNGTYLYTFGPASTQIFTYNSDVNNPFVSPTNAANGVGIKAIESLVVNGDFLFWLGKETIGENGVFQAQGNQITRISNPNIERKISQLKTPDDAIGQCWQENGHIFYSLTFIEGDLTLVYDTLTKEWHTRSSKDPSNDLNHYWRPMFAKLWNGNVLFGTNDGNLIEFDWNNWQEYDGRPIIRLRKSGVLLDNFNYFVVDSVELHTNTGDGTTLNDCKVLIRWSDQGGAWSNREESYIGNQGEYNNRVIWWNLGLMRVGTLELSCSDNIPFNLIGATIRYSEIDM